MWLPWSLLWIMDYGSLLWLPRSLSWIMDQPLFHISLACLVSFRFTSSEISLIALHKDERYNVVNTSISSVNQYEKGAHITQADSPNWSICSLMRLLQVCHVWFRQDGHNIWWEIGETGRLDIKVAFSTNAISYEGMKICWETLLYIHSAKGLEMMAKYLMFHDMIHRIECTHIRGAIKTVKLWTFEPTWTYL